MTERSEGRSKGLPHSKDAGFDVNAKVESNQNWTMIKPTEVSNCAWRAESGEPVTGLPRDRQFGSVGVFSA